MIPRSDSLAITMLTKEMAYPIVRGFAKASVNSTIDNIQFPFFGITKGTNTPSGSGNVSGSGSVSGSG